MIESNMLLSDAAPEEPPVDGNDDTPDGPCEGEEAPEGEESAGDTLSPEEDHKPPAEATEPSENLIDESGHAEAEEDKGPKEAEFPPIEPGGDDTADQANEDASADPAPVCSYQQCIRQDC